MRPPALLRLLWCAAGCALLLGLGRDAFFSALPAPRELPRFDGRSGLPWIEGDFLPTPPLAPGLLPAGIQTAGSWVGSDAWQGAAATAWFKANRRVVHAAVAGHPRLPGCELRAEFRRADGSVVAVPCRIPDPDTEWSRWEIPVPAGAVAVRLVAADRSSAFRGWVAFSHPFRDLPAWLPAAYQGLQLAATLALVLVLLWGPGLLLAPRVSGIARVAVILGTGPLLLAASGALLWAFSPALPVGPTGTALVAVLWLVLGLAARRRRFDILPAETPARLAFAVSALAAAAAATKSVISAGPPGELFQGTVSRNLALSDRIDSRYPFYTAQAVFHGYGPAAPETERLFYPWTFFSRGPLAGLIAVPVIAATQGRPPADFPEQRWSPFDRTGFAAYRLTLIGLSSGIVPALVLGLAPLLGSAWSLVAAGLVALTPFGLHEVMFTWPKWPATAWLVVAFAFAHARRPLAAGLALGGGFLFHPLALLWAPWIGLWAGARAWQAAPARPWPALLAAGTRCTAGALLPVAPWMLAGALVPHLPDTPFAGQGGFVRYFLLADGHLADSAGWLRSRWQNFANSFLPLHLALDPASFGHPKLGSAYEPSPAFVKFQQVWWNTFPFGLGLALWTATLVAAVRGSRSAPLAATLFLALPAAFLVVYWGMDPLGLLREAGHPLLVAAIVFACFRATRSSDRVSRALAHPAAPWLQLPETLLFLWLATLAGGAALPVAHAHLDPLYLALHLAALAAAAHLLARARRLLPAPP